MPVIRHSDAPTFELPGVRFTALVSPSRGSSELSAWQVSLASGTTGEVHGVTREEVFIVTSGAAVATLDGKASDLRVGDALLVPPGAQFSLANPHPEPFTAVVAWPVGGQAVTAHGTFTPPWAQ